MKLILLGIFSTLIGGLIYLIFRPENMVMFVWVERLNLTENVQDLRTIFFPLKSFIPNWIINSLPNALWLFGGLVIIGKLWINSNFEKIIWMSIFIGISIISEFCQYYHFVIPGTFDIIDLITMIIFSYIAVIFTKSNQKKKLTT